MVALPATVGRSATVPSPKEQLISHSGLPQCVRLSFTGREEEQLCLQHCRTPAVDNDSLEVRTSTRSRTRSSRRDGRCACHMRARRLDDAVDGPRAPQSGAAQQEQPPWLHDVHMYHLTHQPALHYLTRPNQFELLGGRQSDARARPAGFDWCAARRWFGLISYIRMHRLGDTLAHTYNGTPYMGTDGR